MGLEQGTGAKCVNMVMIMIKVTVPTRYVLTYNLQDLECSKYQALYQSLSSSQFALELEVWTLTAQLLWGVEQLPVVQDILVDVSGSYWGHSIKNQHTP
jgi:hypothetical protein